MSRQRQVDERAKQPQNTSPKNGAPFHFFSLFVTEKEEMPKTCHIKLHILLHCLSNQHTETDKNDDITWFQIRNEKKKNANDNLFLFRVEKFSEMVNGQKKQIYETSMGVTIAQWA